MDQELVQAAKADPSRFADIYDRYVDEVYRYVFRRVSDKETAEDITSQAFMAAVQAFPRFQWNGAPLTCWLYRIARNKITDWYRKNKRYNVVSIDDTVHPKLSETFEPQIQQIDMRNEIVRAMELLDESDREIITLKYFEDFGNQEIAAVMDISPNHVGVKLHRALKKLRTSLKNYL